MKTKNVLVLFVALLIYTSNKAQSIYMSSANLPGETTTGTHANEVPLEAFEVARYKNDDFFYVGIRKKFNKSSVELLKRKYLGTPNDYTIRFYDKNDVNYYTITLIKFNVGDKSNSTNVAAPFIISPESCANQTDCSKHYEELDLQTPVRVSGCTSANCPKLIFKNELTGDTYTYQ